MADRDIIPLVAEMVKEAETYRDTLSADRVKNTEYYNGIMKDTPSDANRSSVVSRDVRATVQKVLPSLVRIFLSSDQLVEYQPVAKDDSEASQAKALADADQATDYMNGVVFPECKGETVLNDNIRDALKNRNGVLKWWFDKKIEVTTSTHEGLEETAYVSLVNDPEVEPLEHTERQEFVQVPGPAGDLVQVPTTVHDLKIRRKRTKRSTKLGSLALEDFLIHPDAIDEDSAPLIGESPSLRRSDLVAMGYDKAKVDGLPAISGNSIQADAEKQARREDADVQRREVVKELEEIKYYDLLVRIDKDGDGIAELRHMCFGGGITEACLLLDEEADTVDYAITAVEREPHQWEGVSVADNIGDLQRVKTVLFRNTLDNLYWQNNLQIAAKRSAIENPDALTNPQFGQTVWVSEGASVQEAAVPLEVPFVAKESFGMLAYLDKEVQERTGITDASGGLPEDALQNVTAKASAMAEQKGIGQADIMSKTLAVGFARAFRGLLRLTIKYQDKPRTVRLRGKWVTFDPRDWNAEMDCTVNTGLGAGTRERDMAMMGGVLQLQEKIVAGMGMDNPYVKPENVGNAITRYVESSGLKSPDLYVHKPSADEIKAYQQAQASKPNPEQMKMQAQVEGQKQLKMIDVQAEQQTKALEIQANRDKEIAQSRAAVEERQAISAIEAQAAQADRDLKKYEIDKDHEVAMLTALLQNAQSPEVLAIVQGVVAKLIPQNDGMPVMGMMPPQPKVHANPHDGNMQQ